MSKVDNWLNNILNPGYINRDTRRAVLTTSGFKITSAMDISDVPDSPEYLEGRADLTRRAEEMGTRHKDELKRYIVEGFPGATKFPSAKEIEEKLQGPTNFRPGFLRLKSKHESEMTALKGELNSLIEKETYRKQDLKKEQMSSLTTEQKKELGRERSKKIYQTESGRLDRSYRNKNHYSRVGETIKEMQRQRYQTDEEHRTRQIERVKQRNQKPEVKALQAAEARERTRLKNNPLTPDCGCGCGGDLKTHRANFRKKFWSEFQLPKEGSFKIYIAGINMEAYWAGEDWNDCLLSSL